MTRPAAFVALAVLTAGCADRQVPVYPVAGKVTVGGKVVSGAQVIFHPADGTADGTRPNAITGPDGTFQLTTRAKGDGAPAGEYKVLVVRRVQDGPVDEGRSRNVLPEKYNRPDQTPLTATVHPGPNEIPTFNLSAR
jgi:hypothetical protein